MRWSACLVLLAACGAASEQDGGSPSGTGEDDGEGGGEPEWTSPGPYQCGIRAPHGSSCTCDDGRSGTVTCTDCCWCSCPGGSASVCGTGLSLDDGGPVDQCVERTCCDAFIACADADGANVKACASCLDAGGGQLCDDLVACLDAPACEGAPGLCDTGISTGEPEIDACIEPGCCDAFAACTDDLADVDACIACVNAGGGPRCDAFLACWSGCLAAGEGGADGAGGMGAGGMGAGGMGAGGMGAGGG